MPLIVSYSTLAAGAGAIPVPFVDLLLIPGIQAKMVHALADVYGQPMTTERFWEIASSLGTGVRRPAGGAGGGQVHSRRRRRGRRGPGLGLDVRPGPGVLPVLPVDPRGPRPGPGRS